MPSVDNPWADSAPNRRVREQVFITRLGYRSAVRAVHARTWPSESRTDRQYGQQCLRLEGGHEDVTHPKPLQERHFPHTVARSVTRPHKKSCSSHRVHVEHLTAPCMQGFSDGYGVPEKM